MSLASRVLVSLCAVSALGSPNVLADSLGPGLGDVLSAAAPNDRIPVSIVLKDQLRIAPGGGREAAAAALARHAARAQAPLLARLARAERALDASRVRPLWIGNVVGADLTPALAREVAARPEVRHVNWNPKRAVFLGSNDAPAVCGVNRVRAPRAWSELGQTGGGTTVAVIDSGVCYSHPDIANRVWVNPGEDRDHDGVVMDADDVNGIDDDGNGFVDDLVGWNFDAGNRDPNDADGHGSHVAGTIAGDGTSGWQTGVAPGAKVMILRVGGTFADEVDVWSAMQYALANGADVVSLSLGWPHAQNPDRAQWRTHVANLVAAGIPVVVAAGNEGDTALPPDSVRTPADVPEAITVGLADCFDQMVYYSSRGPVTWQGVPGYDDFPYPPGLVKPDVTGPGVATRSLNHCSGYTDMEGTSMATPHVSGTVALMLGKQPGLAPATVKAILEDTALDLAEPGKDNWSGAGRVDAYAAVLTTPNSNGQVALMEDDVSCAFAVHVQVADSDLPPGAPVAVTLASQTEPAGEPVWLLPSAIPGVFRATVSTAGGPPASDGVLQVAHGDTLTVTYVDASDGAGGVHVLKSDAAAVDCAPPAISNVREFEVWTTQAWIRWDTDEPTTGVVEWGRALPLDHRTAGTSLDVMTQVQLFPLTPCTRYVYKVTSTDRALNVAADDNGGLYHDFETPGNFGLGMQNCREGRLAIDADTYACASTLTFRLVDKDLNLDAAVADTVVLRATSATETGGEAVVATETGPDTNLFTGAIALAAGPVASDGALQVAHGDVVTVTYDDAEHGGGAPAVVYDTARTDCRGPRISNLRVENITNARAFVRFDTDEAATTAVDYGPTPALGLSASHPYPVLSRSLLLNQADSCQRVYFRVRATDALGATTVADDNGQPFFLETWKIPGLYWRETFEGTLTGWTLEGEWEVATPQGLGGSSGANRDPVGAYNNQKALGTDFIGRGAFPGDFEPNVDDSALSPLLDARTWRRTRLIVHKSANAGPNDVATLYVRSGPVVPVFDSGTDGYYDFDVQPASWDVASIVDGRPSVQLEFRQRSNGTQQYCGWTVDDIIFKDGALPDYAICGGCGAPPSFAGATGAADEAACAPGGVVVRWDAAPAWGSDLGGTYHVYRGSVPGFAADAAHRLASGLSGNAYTDPAPPAGTSYYLVRSENGETCSTGPHNGGTTDVNARFVVAEETSSQPPAAEVAGLSVTRRGAAHVRLDWPATAGAATYRVLRSAAPQPASFAALASTTARYHEDLDQGANAATWFYLVRGVNRCGQEGP